MKEILLNIIQSLTLKKVLVKKISNISVYELDREISNFKNELTQNNINCKDRLITKLCGSGNIVLDYELIVET